MATIRGLNILSGAGGNLPRFNRSRLMPRSSNLLPSPIGSSLQSPFQPASTNPAGVTQAERTLEARQVGGLSGAFSSSFAAPIATGARRFASSNTDGLTTVERTARLEANRRAAQSDFQGTWSSQGYRRGLNSRRLEDDGNDN